MILSCVTFTYENGDLERDLHQRKIIFHEHEFPLFSYDVSYAVSLQSDADPHYDNAGLSSLRRLARTQASVQIRLPFGDEQKRVLLRINTEYIATAIV